MSDDGSSRKAWQKCPLCDGEAVWMYQPPTPVGCIPSCRMKVTCPCCNGRRIISIDTGSPPMQPYTLTTPEE